MDTLFRCIEEGTAPGRVVDFAKNYLRQEGFEELYYDRLFSPKVEGKSTGLFSGRPNPIGKAWETCTSFSTLNSTL